MRPFISLLLVLFIASSCSQQAGSQKNIEESPVAAEEGTPDDVSGMPLLEDDTRAYIGFVYPFPETNEYYTSLYFQRDGVMEEDWSRLLDSIVYEDDEVRRVRLPMTEAQQLLDLSQLHRLTIYNENHEVINHARLVRIERLDMSIESEFVAVYKPDLNSHEEPHYGVSYGRSLRRIPGFSVQPVVDKDLDDKVVEKTGLTSGECVIVHYKVMPARTVYSIVSSVHESFLLAIQEGNVVILKHNADDAIIISIDPLPFLVNSKPSLLITEGVRETDMLWNYLAVYNDSAYVAAERSRIFIR
jgi:hypothetical protein